MKALHSIIIGISLILFISNLFYMEVRGITEYYGSLPSNPTTFAETLVPPIIRQAPPNPRILDSFGTAPSGPVISGQQIQIVGELNNNQDRDQPFVYVIQIQDGNNITVSLSWIAGTLTAGQSFKPAQSWTPTAAGTYTINIFVWQSIKNPNSLVPPTMVEINVV